ncbi:Alpha/Beta hydrolase protein [Phyllosticta capitalensis]|uniref:Alpha/Beta hydrolase protein n=1 Tax=Phyllosticta capitalensis TaxID=121624 RepID=A0ABR1Z1G8_9PEZI
MDSRLEHVFNALVFGYGVLAALYWLWFALVDGSLLRRRTKEAEKELAAARRRFWDLSASPLPNFEHAFFTTDAGVKLHYVVSSWNPGNNPNLVILVHGFPDSWVLWREFLTRQKLDNETVYVALDLPGFGGSDSLPVYDADNVLETVTAFVLGMRERCIQEEDDDRGQVVIVSHDWGAAVASRLASEAPQLADHWILTSAPITPLAMNNMSTRLASAQRMIHTWMQEPLRLTLLRNAFRTVEPILSQLRKSSYIFAFRLPVPLIRIVSRLTGTTYLGVVHTVAAQGLAQSAPSQKSTYTAEALASSLGPGPEQCVAPPTASSSSSSDTKTTSVDTSASSLAYAPSVAARARSPTLAWLNQTAYYRDGVGVHRWTKSLQTILSLSALDPTSSAARRRSSLSVGASLFDSAGDGPRGLLRAPTTVVVGAGDVAFDWRLALEGIAEYVGRKGGAVVVIERAGHWLVREDVGVKVLARVVAGVVGADEEIGGDGEGEGVVEKGAALEQRKDSVNGEDATAAVMPAAGKGAVAEKGPDEGGMKGLLAGLPGVKVVVER